LLKRIFDIVASGVAIIALSPLILPIMLTLRFTGEGDVFYLQERVGRGGRRFWIYKFATMLRDSPRLTGGDITIANDPRVLPLGGFLRKTKINELPQLFNILMGDMSIIGPRPLTPRVAELFPMSHWAALADCRPGLSSVGSIVFRDEERMLQGVVDRERVYATAIVPYKSELEKWYVEHQSFWLDIKLIFFTLAAVVNPVLDLSRSLPGLPEAPEALTTLWMLRDKGH
jgi:lipopolysaccharide/colanic/teichoic acid biosynthesis glycosyltransferase